MGNKIEVPLINHIKNQDLKSFKENVEFYKLEINHFDSYKKTILMFVASKEELEDSFRFEIINLLLENGADANIGNPLYLLLKLKNVNIKTIELLLKNGAKPNGFKIGNDCQFSLLTYEEIFRKDILDLFFQYKVNLYHHHYNYLKNAIYSKNIEKVKYLLNKGFNPNLNCGVYGENFLLAFAYEKKLYDIFKLLLDYSCSPNATIKISDIRFNLLNFLMMKGEVKYITLLLKANVDVDIFENFIETQKSIKKKYPIIYNMIDEYLLNKYKTNFIKNKNNEYQKLIN